MSTAQKAFGSSLLVALVLAGLQEWQFEALVGGSYPKSAIERLVLEAPAYLPHILAPFLIVQAAILVVWAVRSPRATDAARYRVALKLLGEWLRWSLVVLAIVAAAAVGAMVAGTRLTVVFMTLIPFFGLAYLASAYRAFQVQAYRLQAGLSAIKCSDLALGVVFPAMVMPLWPFGLLVPGWVARQARLDPPQ